MNKLLQDIFEATALPLSYKGKSFYYGVPDRVNALKIWEEGQIPIFSGKKGYDTRTYLSNFLSEACNYADVTLGRKYAKNTLKSKGRYGYIFFVSGQELRDIFPNESEIGRFIQEIYNHQYDRKDLDPATFRFLTWVWSILDRQAQKSIIYDEADAYHEIGKKVLNDMTDVQILWLLGKKDLRITNEGLVGFSRLYRVDRMSVADFDLEGEDFIQKSFEVGTKEDII